LDEDNRNTGLLSYFAVFRRVRPGLAFDGGMPTTTLMSFAEFERLDGGADQMELLNGELIRMPPAFRPHMEICRRLFRLLDHWVEQYRQTEKTPKGGTVFLEMGYLLSTEPASWLQPDVSLTHADQEGEILSGRPLNGV
jgi:Uma2 family endonuclease